MYEYTFQRRQISETPIDASSPSAIVRATKGTYLGAESEILVVAALDNQSVLVGYEAVYKGNVSCLTIRVGELFRLPIRLNASSIVLVHNHPSGNLSPSEDDIGLSGDVIAAGTLLDIPVLDHIIVSGDGYSYRSLKDDLRCDFPTSKPNHQGGTPHKWGWPATSGGSR